MSDTSNNAPAAKVGGFALDWRWAGLATLKRRDIVRRYVELRAPR